MLFFSRDLGIDLGTSNVLIYAAGRGIVLREPSVIALDKNSGKVLQVGAAARNMLGRTPGNVVAVHPLQDGVISDYELTARMLTEMLRRVLRHAIVKPRMIVTVPSGITEVEERAVIQAAMEAGARRVYLIEAPLAAALGAQLDITAPEGRMVVDIGGGTTDIGVLTMNGIAQSASLKVAGAAFDEAIIRHLRRRYGLLIGTTVAEEIKMSIGCVTPRPEALTMTVKGRDLKNGLAREATLTSEELMEVLRRPGPSDHGQGARCAREHHAGARGGHCAQWHRPDGRRQPALRHGPPAVRAHGDDVRCRGRRGFLRSLRLRQEPELDEPHAGGHDQPRPPPPAEGVSSCLTSLSGLRRSHFFRRLRAANSAGLFEIIPTGRTGGAFCKNRDRRKPPIPAFWYFRIILRRVSGHAP